MYKRIALAFLIVPQFMFAQNTTETEYNYMKKGYRQVAESGLDVKRGYVIQELSPMTYEGVTIYFTKLLREKDKSIAGIIVKSASSQSFGSGTTYYAIPAVNSGTEKSFGWDDFFSDVVNVMTTGVKNVMLRWLAYRMSYEMAGNKQ